MKIQNLLSVIFLTILTISCSMDESVINDIDKEIQNNTEAYAYFSLDLNAGSTVTKTSSATEKDPIGPNDEENRVNTCYLAVFNSNTGDLLASHFYKGGNEGDIIPGDGNITFKISGENKPDLKFVAITNINYSSDPEYSDVISLIDLQKCKKYTDLMRATIKENPTVLVKVGESVLAAKDYETSSSLLTDHEKFCKTVTIPVTQRSAAIELESFLVQKKNNNTSTELKVKDVSVQLQNINMKTTVKEGSVTEIYDNGTLKNWNVDNAGTLHLYTYSNESESKTTLKISYILDGVEGTKYAYYTIKTPASNSLGYEEKVKANTLYKLKVTITNEVVDVAVKCYTMDWKDGGNYEVEVKPSTKNQ